MDGKEINKKEKRVTNHLMKFWEGFNFWKMKLINWNEIVKFYKDFYEDVFVYVEVYGCIQLIDAYTLFWLLLCCCVFGLVNLISPWKMILHN